MLQLPECNSCIPVGDGPCPGVNEVGQGIDDHQGPHGHSCFDGLAVSLALVVLDGHGTAGHVHHAGSEAVEDLQEVGRMGEEDVGDEQRQRDEDRGADGDHAHEFAVDEGLAVVPRLGPEVQVVLAKEGDADEGQGDFCEFQGAAEGADSLNVECQTHFQRCLEIISLRLPMIRELIVRMTDRKSVV